MQNISTLKRKERKALQEYIGKLYKLYSGYIEKIILFGSKVRGDAGKDSDIDILIVIRNGSKELKNKITDLAFEIILKYGVDIEPTIFDKKEWMRLTKIPTSFVYCVLKEGKEL